MHHRDIKTTKFLFVFTKKFSLVLVVFLLVSCASIPSIEPAETQNINNVSGQYRRGYDKDNTAGCLLNVVLEPNAPFDEIDVELYCNRGAPSYGSGYGAGKIFITDNIAVYTPSWQSSDEVKCNIVFQFENNSVKVTQLGSDFDCGFGHGVYANGYYELVDEQTPVLGCLHPVQISKQCMTPTTSE